MIQKPEVCDVVLIFSMTKSMEGGSRWLEVAKYEP